MCYFFQNLNRSNQYVGRRKYISWGLKTCHLLALPYWSEVPDKKNLNNKHLILHKKLMVFRTAITLQNTVLAVFVKFIHRLYDVCQPWTVSPIWDVLFILLPAPSLVFCDTQCSLCSTGRLVFLRFIDSRVKFHGNNLFTLYKLEKNLWRGQFREDGGKQVFLIIVFCH